MIDNDLSVLRGAFDRESWEWLQEAAPDLADALAHEVKRNASPDTIKRFTLRYTQRPKLAQRLEQAAAYLATEHGRSAGAAQ